DFERYVGENPDFHDILEIGDNLSDIFQATGKPERTQSSVSGGGAAWEGLVTWYLNLGLIGSRAVVVKHKKSLIPDPVAKAITVNYGSFRSNTESDLIAITFPKEPDIMEDKKREELKFKNDIDNLCESHFEELEVGVIQCKTNWNDNAQIPMLWEMVYSSKGFEDGNITIGTGGFSMKDFRDFFYSFVTVPTTQNLNYTPDSTNVKRVQHLSGGNYWGKETQDGVAQSIKEIFNGNFDYAFGAESQRKKVESALKSDLDLSYFDIEPF
ncbi:MAG: hypothetical protein ABEI86_08960, partial [Halobacteriaceae archaeon]